MMSTGVLCPAVRPESVQVTTCPFGVQGPEGLKAVVIVSPAGTASVKVSGLPAGPWSVTVDVSSAGPPAGTVPPGWTAVVTALSSVETTVAATSTASGPLVRGLRTSPGVTGSPRMISPVYPNAVQAQLTLESPPSPRMSPAETIIGEAGVNVATPPAGRGLGIVSWSTASIR